MFNVNHFNVENLNHKIFAFFILKLFFFQIFIYLRKMVCMAFARSYYVSFFFLSLHFAVDGFNNPQGVSPPESFEMINSVEQPDNSGKHLFY